MADPTKRKYCRGVLKDQARLSPQGCVSIDETFRSFVIVGCH